MPINAIARNQTDPYLDTVTRALMTTADTSQTGFDYHRLDYSELLTFAATENTPFSVRLARAEAARAIKHFWLEQALTDAAALTPLAETADAALGSAHTPARYENAMMAIGKKFQMSDELGIVARAGGLIAVGNDEFGRQLAMQSTLMIRDQEKAIVEGVYDDGGTGNPRQIKGLLGDYKNGNENGWINEISATMLDAGGVEFSATNADALLNQAMIQIALLYAGPYPNTLYVPPQVLRPLALATQGKIQITVPWDQVASGMPTYGFGSAVGKWYSNFGPLNIVFHPLLTTETASGSANKAHSRMLLVYEPAIRLIDYVGWGGVHIDMRPKTDRSETRAMHEIFSLEVRYRKSHGNIKNFWVDTTK